MIAPGAPQVAAIYAYHDAKLDHSEDGVWAAMFLAAVGSAAFFLSDPIILCTIGLAMIPRTCRTARAVKTAIAAWQRAASWLEARESVQHESGNKNFTDAPQNLGFFAIGLLYGQRDFGTSLCASVNCSYDAETTGGAMGAVMGIIKGSANLPHAWIAPIGDLVIPGLGMRDYDAPLSLVEVVERTVAVGRTVVGARCPDVAITEGGGVTGNTISSASSSLSSSLAPSPSPAFATAPATIASRFAELDLGPSGTAEQETGTDAPDASLTLPDSPLASQSPPSVILEVAPGEALPYMQPAQTQEQPLATDPNLIADMGSGVSNGPRKRKRSGEETGLTLHTDEDDLNSTLNGGLNASLSGGAGSELPSSGYGGLSLPDPLTAQTGRLCNTTNTLAAATAVSGRDSSRRP